MDRAGKLAIDFQFDHASQFHEGLARVNVGGRHGFIDRSGRMAIEPQFGPETQGFGHGLAMAQAADGTCGFIDRSGDFVIAPTWDWAQPYQEGRARVRLDGRYGYINADGRVVVPPQYRLASDYCEGLAVVHGESGCWFIDADGEQVFGPFQSAGSFSDDVASVKNQGQRGLLDHHGAIHAVEGLSWVSEYCCDGRIEFKIAGFDGPVWCEAKDRYGFLDRRAQVVIPPRYEDASTFREGMAGVRIEGKWGFIDTDGTMVIDPRFDAAGRFVCGWARAKTDGKSAYIDRTGNIVVRTDWCAPFPYSEDLTPVYIEV
jgi:hypothetical protein